MIDTTQHISEVFNEDCMIGMARYPDKYFDLAVVDPPYGIGVGKMAYTQAAGRSVKQKNGTRLIVNQLGYDHKNWDIEIPNTLYFNELIRISKHQIVWGINYYPHSGLRGSGVIKWDKGVPNGMSFNKYEYAYCSLIDYEMNLQLLWAGMCQAKSIAEPMTQQGNKKLNEKRIHPCHKPTMLYSIIYDAFLPQGGKVIDTHLGSGSNRIAANKAGNIDFVGFELDRDYYEAQEKRWKGFISQTRLF